MSPNFFLTIKVFEDEKLIKTVHNCSVNFGVDYESLKKQLRFAIRLAPTDPQYRVERIFLCSPNCSDIIELDPTEIEELHASLLKPHDNKLMINVSCLISIVWLRVIICTFL